MGGVQALSEEHLRQVLLPDMQQRIRNGGTSGQTLLQLFRFVTIKAMSLKGFCFFANNIAMSYYNS